VQAVEKEVMYRLVEVMLTGGPLSSKDVKKLSTELQEKVGKMDAEIRVARERNQLEAERIAKESKELASDRLQVSRQLRALNELFKDPSSVDRIEPYENPFTSGNLELLKKAAKTIHAVEKR
jgi:hypothetical protein